MPINGSADDILFGYLCNLRPIRPGGVAKYMEKDIPSKTGITSALLVTDFVNNEE